jgi:hypothetical protein
MSILNAIKKVKQDNNNLQDLALLPQPLIMQMAQRGEISKELVPLIIGKKAEMIEAVARQKALAQGGGQQPSVMEQKMMEIAQAENPAPATMPAPQLPEQVGIAQNPVAPMQMAGGGIIAFANTGLVDDDEDDDDDTSYEDYLDEIERSRLESMIMNTYRDSDTGGAGIAYAEPSTPKSEKVGIKTVSKDKEPDDIVKRLQAQIMAKESGGRRYDKEGKLLTSSKGAEGEMQVMPYTARDPGFGVRPARDNSPDELRRVGDEYAAAMYRRYGDPKIAMIAYNMGPGATDQWLADGADPRKLPKETQGYIRNVNLAGGGIIAFANRGRVIDDFGNVIDDEEVKKSSKPLSKEAERFLKGKAGQGEVKPLTQPPSQKLRPSMIGSDANVYPGMSDLNYYNELKTALEKDPTYEPYKEEMDKLLKRTPNLLTATQPATNIIGPLANVQRSEGVGKTESSYTPPVYLPGADNEDAATGMGMRDLLAPKTSVNSAAPPQTEAVMSAQDKLFAQMQDAFSKREARLAQARELDPYLALTSAGLAIAGGTSPYALTNIGQGGAQGVAQYAALQRGRAAEEAGLGSLQNKMLTTAMTGELRKDMQAQSNSAKYANALSSVREQRLQLENKYMAKPEYMDLGMLQTYAQRLSKNPADKEAKAKYDSLIAKKQALENKIRKELPDPDPSLFGVKGKSGNVIVLD